MKRFFTIIPLLAATFVQPSCVKKDVIDCPPVEELPASLTLTFDLRDASLWGTRAEADSVDLLDVVEAVDVYLFDENMDFVESRRLEMADLENFCGTVFENIEPGTYNAVCWGNLSDRDALPDLEVGESFDECYIAIKANTTGGPIYYGPGKPIETFTYDGDGGGGMPMRSGIVSRADDFTPFQAEVVASQDNLKPVEFDNVHRKVRVFIDGWEYADFYDKLPPVVENCDASNRYDFFLRADDTPASLMQISALTDTYECRMYGALFYSAMVPLSESMGICLYNQTNKTVADGVPGVEIHFDDWMQENDWTDDQDMALIITFHPTDGNSANVSVSVPSWIRRDVTSEY